MRTVLIIEPSTVDARALRKCLREAGLVNPSTVLKSGAEAKRRLAARDHYGIMLLNVHAADGEGMALLDWLRAQKYHEDLLVIAVGERGRLRGVVEACERGAHSFLIKPVHVEDLKTLARSYPDHWTRAAE